MKHIAKKISAGKYEYRGWIIEKKKCSFSNIVEWVATYGTLKYEYETLADAKDDIDFIEEEAIAEEERMNEI